MANSKISELTNATIPLTGTEVLPIVQSGATVKVANNDLRPKQIQSNATSGVLQIAGPAAAATRTMTVPDANFTAARTDSANSFTGNQTLSTGNIVIGTSNNGITTNGSIGLGFGTNGNTNTFYVNSSNKFLVGINDNSFPGKFLVYQTVSANECASFWNSATTGDNNIIKFYTDGGSGRGNITYNRGAGLIAYNITSDYRAKDIIGPVQNPGAIIDALKIYEGKMKGATYSFPMLIAHETQEIAPYAVTGKKDAVDKNNNPLYQQIDVSLLIPLMLAEIQNLRLRITQLELL